MKRAKIRIFERATTLSKMDSFNFDLYFWQRQTPTMRFVAAWQMLEDFYKIRGIHGYKLRLQRSVQNIKQI